jgi:hypothetical protein
MTAEIQGGKVHENLFGGADNSICPLEALEWPSQPLWGFRLYEVIKKLIHGLFFVYGLFTMCLWFIHGLFTVCSTWVIVHGLCMVCSRFVPVKYCSRFVLCGV